MFGGSEYLKVFVYRGKSGARTGNLLFRPEHGPSIKVRVNKRKLSLDPNMTRQSSGLARAMPWVVKILAWNRKWNLWKRVLRLTAWNNTFHYICNCWMLLWRLSWIQWWVLWIFTNHFNLSICIAIVWCIKLKGSLFPSAKSFALSFAHWFVYMLPCWINFLWIQSMEKTLDGAGQCQFFFVFEFFQKKIKMSQLWIFKDRQVCWILILLPPQGASATEEPVIASRVDIGL